MAVICFSFRKPRLQFAEVAGNTMKWETWLVGGVSATITYLIVHVH